jgi:hypothetical protein
MANALDAFRAQQEAAEAVQARLSELLPLVEELRRQVDTLALHPELRELLREEQHWLERAHETVLEVRRWREREQSRFITSVVWRWLVAAVFALSAAAAAGAGYARVTGAHAAELAALRQRAELATLIEVRLRSMNASERRQFDLLMKFPDLNSRSKVLR